MKAVIIIILINKEPLLTQLKRVSWVMEDFNNVKQVDLQELDAYNCVYPCGHCNLAKYFAFELIRNSIKSLCLQRCIAGLPSASFLPLIAFHQSMFARV